MAHLRKGDVFELQRPIDGDVSPGSHDGLSEHGESAIDSADMRRLGRTQQLQVWICGTRLSKILEMDTNEVRRSATSILSPRLV